DSHGVRVHDSDIQAAVARALTAKGWSTGLTNAYFVFLPYGMPSCADGADSSCSVTAPLNVQFCAYHGWYTDNQNRTVIYGAMPDAGNTGGGYACSVRDQFGNHIAPNGDWVADAEISLISHELSEAITDPTVGDATTSAWYDSSGNEDGDKCAWNFGTLNSNG